MRSDATTVNGCLRSYNQQQQNNQLKARKTENKLTNHYGDQ